MSHDSEASFASGEVADIIQGKASAFFGSLGRGGTWQLSSGREGSSNWPLADGIIQAENTKEGVDDVNIAFEYKRPNEGVHGILTAVGQSLAYLDKGYDASVIVIPKKYSSHSNPGEHVRNIIDTTAPDAPITVYTYDTPNLAAMRPFYGKLECTRDIDLSACRKPTRASGARRITGQINTVWAHMREGMSHPDAFFKYCQAVKIRSSIDETLSEITLPEMLIEASRRVKPDVNPLYYLSSTSGDTISDRAWRYIWYASYFWNDLRPIYRNEPDYIVNSTSTLILKDPDNYQNLFSGRRDSIKQKLVDQLRESRITEEDAWDQYAKKVHSDAHSYREVIDSGLYQIGFLDSEGNLTDIGYKYVNACEKGNGAYDETAMNILRAASLHIGQYDVFLYTIYKYSQSRFADDFNAFTSRNANGAIKFENGDYLDWLNDVFTNQLHMLKKSSLRAGGTRKPFQAEMSYLKKLGFVYSDSGIPTFKRGIGLNIDWPLVESSMSYFTTL